MQTSLQRIAQDVYPLVHGKQLLEGVHAWACCSAVLTCLARAGDMGGTLSCSKHSLRQIWSGTKSARAPMNWPACSSTAQHSTQRQHACGVAQLCH